MRADGRRIARGASHHRNHRHVRYAHGRPDITISFRHRCRQQAAPGQVFPSGKLAARKVCQGPWSPLNRQTGRFPLRSLGRAISSTGLKFPPAGQWLARPVQAPRPVHFLKYGLALGRSRAVAPPSAAAPAPAEIAAPISSDSPPLRLPSEHCRAFTSPGPLPCTPAPAELARSCWSRPSCWRSVSGCTHTQLRRKHGATGLDAGRHPPAASAQ